MFNLFKFPMAAAALFVVPMMASAQQNDIGPQEDRGRHEDATFVRLCHFDAPDQADDCSAEIISCDFDRGGPRGGMDPAATTDLERNDRNDRDRDEDRIKCRDELKITCGRDRIFKGPYTEDFKRGVVRVTAGKHPRPGAPEIIHDAFRYLPSRVDAKLILGDSFLRGSCRGKLVR